MLPLTPTLSPASVQTRRLEQSRSLLERFNASLFPRHTGPAAAGAATTVGSLRPLEGFLPAGCAARQIDPLGLARTRHDVPPKQTLAEWLSPETAALKAAFARHGIDRVDGDYRETLHVKHAVPDAPDLVVRVQNIVHTNYIASNTTQRDLDSDDESWQGDGAARKHPASAVHPASAAAADPYLDTTDAGYRRHARIDDDSAHHGDGDDDDLSAMDIDMEIDSSDTSHGRQPRADADAEADADAMDDGAPFSKPSRRPPTLFSLRQVQRRWLGMGYHKNRVGTAIGIHYARPWSGSQLAFPKGRVLGTGTHSRIVDRVQLIYGLCAYLRKAGAHGIALKTRTSQNFVAKCQLPTKTGLCLGRICQQLKDKAHPTKEFTGIVVNWPPATLLLFEHGSMICIGTSSIAQLEQAVSTVAPVVMANFRTPENELQEQSLFKLGVLKDFTADQLRPRLADWDAETSKQRRRNNEARRRPKVRYMGVF